MFNKNLVFLSLLFSLNIFFGCSTGLKEAKNIALTNNWKFRKVGDSIYLQAKVPGLVHLDLIKHGIIDDPFYRSNEDSVQWVADENWEYLNEFSLCNEFLKNKNIELCFEGLDTYADVYLNDSLIIEANNMFQQWSAEVSSLLKQKNQLLVYFHSPTKKNLEAAQKSTYPLPEQRAFTRKAPYQFGWDWGPKLSTSGIWKSVNLSAKKEVEIATSYFRTDSIKGTTAFLSVEIKIKSEVDRIVDLKISNEDHLNITKNINLKVGINTKKVNLQIPEAKLWWTNGLGKPHLYEFKIEIIDDGKLMDSFKNKIGIRTVKLVQKEDENGESFFFELNGIPVFMKGANYIPQDNFLTRVDSLKYISLIENARLANMNMLRVWGGGIYENDLFYNLCDENGILIWQDFMFAGSMYPGDKNFIENCKSEATQQIIRLRNHPSIALWCGNNEVDEAWHNWGWQQQFNYSEDQQKEIWDSYQLLFHQTLPDLVKTLDQLRDYWPSSPSTGWGHKESLEKGDSHYWGVWWGNEPFEIYEEKVGRFMSEYGFQAFPAISTLDSVLLPEDKYFISPALQTHEKHNRGFEIIKTYMDREYKIPEKFEDYAYVSQLLQAKGIGTAIEAHRRAKPYCMGTLYWQLNDCWPVISWSSIDYYGNWKALHYEAKKDFNNLMISIDQQNDTVFIWIVSDQLEDVKSELSLQLFDFEGKVLWEEEAKVNILANSSKAYFKFSINEKFGSIKLNKILLKASLKDKTEINRLHYFTETKNLLLPIPQISSSIKKAEQGYEITLSTNKLAKNIYLNLEGVSGHFTKNYFDLLPGISQTITFQTQEKIKNPAELLKIKSLADTY